MEGRQGKERKTRRKINTRSKWKEDKEKKGRKEERQILREPNGR